MEHSGNSSINPHKLFFVPFLSSDQNPSPCHILPTDRDRQILAEWVASALFLNFAFDFQIATCSVKAD